MLWGRRGRDREVLGFTTIYAISAYCEFESHSSSNHTRYNIMR
jgi:hypothetical protein